MNGSNFSVNPSPFGVGTWIVTRNKDQKRIATSLTKEDAEFVYSALCVYQSRLDHPEKLICFHCKATHAHHLLVDGDDCCSDCLGLINE